MSTEILQMLITLTIVYQKYALTRGQMTAKDKPTMDKQIANTISPLFRVTQIF